MDPNRLDLPRQLREYFALEGAVPLDVAETCIPVINAFNLDDPPYHAKRGFAGSLSVTPSAGQYALAACEFADQGDTGIAVVRYVSIAAGANPVGCVLGWGTSSVVTNSWRPFEWDQREGTNGAPTPSRMTMSRGHAVAAAPLGVVPQIWSGVVSPNSERFVPGPFVFDKDMVLRVYAFHPAVELYVGFYGDVYDLG